MGAFTVIDHTEIGTGGAAYWEETGISSSYDHLLIKASIRGEKVAVVDSGSIRFNGLTSSVYSSTTLYAQTATPVSAREGARNSMDYLFWPGASTLADSFGSMTVWVPHYANTANFKQAIISTVSPNNSTTDNEWATMVTAGLFAATAAISEVKIFSGHGTDLAEYSTITLYGVTGA
jgi:hypothetical protein